MTDHVYEMSVRITVRGAEEPEKSPDRHVIDAVKTLLDDHGWEWLLEAIGHPHPENFEVEVSSNG